MDYENMAQRAINGIKQLPDGNDRIASLMSLRRAVSGMDLNGDGGKAVIAQIDQLLGEPQPRKQVVVFGLRLPFSRR